MYHILCYWSIVDRAGQGVFLQDLLLMRTTVLLRMVSFNVPPHLQIDYTTRNFGRNKTVNVTKGNFSSTQCS